MANIRSTNSSHGTLHLAHLFLLLVKPFFCVCLFDVCLSSQWKCSPQSQESSSVMMAVVVVVMMMLMLVAVCRHISFSSRLASRFVRSFVRFLVATVHSVISKTERRSCSEGQTHSHLCWWWTTTTTTSGKSRVLLIDNWCKENERKEQANFELKKKSSFRGFSLSKWSIQWSTMATISTQLTKYIKRMNSDCTHSQILEIITLSLFFSLNNCYVWTPFRDASCLIIIRRTDSLIMFQNLNK